ncbi:hypothetical protein [Paracoccus aminovorans]|uniref:hypothetical protein n=1 Tax=Paracoccus aminovorans TaxID=34004 RepID=UPI002B25D52B|nr:hypothetical protein [Paracoccus aminovorans]
MRLAFALALCLAPALALADIVPDRVMECTLIRRCNETDCLDIRQPLALELIHVDGKIIHQNGSQGIAARFAWNGQVLETLADLYDDGGVELVLPSPGLPQLPPRPVVALYAKPNGPIRLAAVMGRAGHPKQDIEMWFGTCDGGLA